MARQEAQQLSLDEVIEFSKGITNWNLHGDEFQGISSSPKRFGDPTIYIGVSKQRRIFRSPAYHVWVQCTMNTLADYTDPRVKEIYDSAEKIFKECAPADRERGIEYVKSLLQRSSQAKTAKSRSDDVKELD